MRGRGDLHGGLRPHRGGDPGYGGGGRGVPDGTRRAAGAGLLRGGEPLERPAGAPPLQPPGGVARAEGAGNPAQRPP